MTEPITSNGIEQADYLQLLMQELTYQDPLNPIDNREFMTQMAQFSLLQEERTTNEHLTQLLGMTSSNQGLSLLGKKVHLNDREGEGQVTKIVFTANTPPQLSVLMNNNELAQIELGQITEVRN